MPGWESIIGHDDIIRYMKQAAAEECPSHAYLLSGNKGAGKKLLAETFAMALECTGAPQNKPCMECHSCKQAASGNHPDIIRLHHEKPNLISVDDIRRIVSDMAIKPYEGRYKIYIIDEAEKMNPQAQNALLKTLEEPPAYGIILLLTPTPDALLQTIRSRCVLLKLRNLKDALIRNYLVEQLQMDTRKSELCTAFAQGSMGRAMSLAQSEEFNEIRGEVVWLMKYMGEISRQEAIAAIKKITERKVSVEDYLDIMAIWFRDVLLYKATGDLDRLVFKDEQSFIREQASRCSYNGIDEILLALKKAGTRLHANVSFELVMDLLLLTIKENV